MLEVRYAANSTVRKDQMAGVLEGAALMDILKNMSDAELAELEDELNFAHFTGIFGPILSGITCDSSDSNRTPSRAA